MEEKRRHHNGNRALQLGRLSSRVKAQGLAPRDISVVWEFSGGKFLAFNGITKEPLNMGSRHAVVDLLRSAGEFTVETDEGGFRWISPLP